MIPGHSLRIKLSELRICFREVRISEYRRNGSSAESVDSCDGPQLLRRPPGIPKEPIPETRPLNPSAADPDPARIINTSASGSGSAALGWGLRD